jgi:hypothetical protein
MSDVIQKVEAEVKAVETAVVNEIKKVEAAAERIIQELSAEEKLAIRELENKYLKAQMEVNRLTEIIKAVQTEYTKTTEGLVKKYAISPAEWVFDNAELLFKKVK